MKVLCNGADLADALNKVAKALPIKKTQPILEGIKISAMGDSLTVTATDCDFTIIKNIKADIKMEGEVLVPGKLITDLSRSISNEDMVELSDISDDNLTIKYSDSNTFLKLMNLVEYPVIADVDYDNKITMLQKDFKDMVSKTIFAAATDGIRVIFKGCLIEIEKSEIRMVALDGYRLALCNKELPMEYPQMSIIVPAKSLQEIAKLLTDDEEVVNINVGKDSILVDVGHTKIKSNLLSGTFINYKNTIPKDFETQITVDKKLFDESIERASILSRYDKNNLVKLEVKEGNMLINSNSESGESKQKINVFTKGKDVNIGFNAKYISDCLKCLNDEFVLLKISSSTSPAIIMPVEGNGYLYLILPIR